MSKKLFAPHSYIKDESFDPIYKPINKKFLFKTRFYPAILISVGIVVLSTQVIMPLVVFKTEDEITKPIASTVLGVATGFNEFTYNELDAYKTKGITTNLNIPKYFYISIAKLGIKNAKVETNSTNLDPETALGHYKGTALPGEVGNAFIYGHSVLPWFFNPKNYKTIFSTLDHLDTGDTIIITYNNKEMTYKVEEKETLAPDKVNPLYDYKPKYLNESTITLMTCTPAGTRINRLLVNAVKID